MKKAIKELSTVPKNLIPKKDLSAIKGGKTTSIIIDDWVIE